MNIHLARLLIVAAPLLLTHCAIVDPGYERLAAQADPNPPSDAIVGMWHRNTPTAGCDVRYSSLFRRDGTGVARSVARGWGSEQRSDGEFTWAYSGQGVWISRWLQDGTLSRIRLASGKLLVSQPNPLGGRDISLVFERVE